MAACRAVPEPGAHGSLAHLPSRSERAVFLGLWGLPTHLTVLPCSWAS